MSAGLGGAVTDVIATVRADGRDALLEPEALAVAAALGIRAPHHRVLRTGADTAALDLSAFGTDRVVVKVLSPEIPHRSDVGGIAIVEADSHAVRHAVEDMQERLGSRGVRGYLVAAMVPHAADVGAELMLGVRWADDFGPVVTFGPGGAAAEFLAGQLDGGHGTAVLAPGITTPAAVEEILDRRAVARLATGRVRGGIAHTGAGQLRSVLASLLEFAGSPAARQFAEFEINPLVWTADGPVALDALGRLRVDTPPAPPRPIEKIERLLRPRSIAVVGVSERTNPGRVILQNTLRAGFPAERLGVVKPDVSSIDGVRCYADLHALPGPVDLLVVSVAADRVPALLEETIRDERAESIVVIPGGLGERAGTESRERAVMDALHRARAGGGGPVVNGGNCLGIRSVPGRYDTTFIPDYKLPRRPAAPAPVALITQSGALAVSVGSKLPGVNPRYVITVGNQVDLTVGDYLTHLAADPDIDVFGCYVEGFRPLDGRRFLEAAATIAAQGRRVILFLAGRTATGTRAMVSHTAAVAGDYAVARELARAAGVELAETLDDFADLLRLHAMLGARRPAGWRLGALSNAGFECVAVADALGPFTLAEFGERTRAALDGVLRTHSLQEVVQVGNPMDLTPIVADAGYEAAARAVLADEGVDVGIVGVVPLTGALDTLPAADGHGEDVRAPGSVVSRLAALRATTPKPWVAVVDAGADYDPAAALLAERGVPTFRTVDRALELFGQWCRSYLEPAIGQHNR